MEAYECRWPRDPRRSDRQEPADVLDVARGRVPARRHPRRRDRIPRHQVGDHGRRDRRGGRDRDRRDRVVGRGAYDDRAHPCGRGHARAGQDAAQRRRRTVHRDRVAQAEGLHRRRSGAERVRVRTLTGAGRRRGDVGPLELDVAPRARRCARARAVAHQEPRRAGHDARGDDGRCTRRGRGDRGTCELVRRLGRRRQRRRGDAR